MDFFFLLLTYFVPTKFLTSITTFIVCIITSGQVFLCFYILLRYIALYRITFYYYHHCCPVFITFILFYYCIYYTSYTHNKRQYERMYHCWNKFYYDIRMNKKVIAGLGCRAILYDIKQKVLFLCLTALQKQKYKFPLHVYFYGPSSQFHLYVNKSEYCH